MKSSITNTDTVILDGTEYRIFHVMLHDGLEVSVAEYALIEPIFEY